MLNSGRNFINDCSKLIMSFSFYHIKCMFNFIHLIVIDSLLKSNNFVSVMIVISYCVKCCIFSFAYNCCENIGIYFYFYTLGKFGSPNINFSFLNSIFECDKVGSQFFCEIFFYNLFFSVGSLMTDLHNISKCMMLILVDLFI